RTRERPGVILFSTSCDNSRFLPSTFRKGTNLRSYTSSLFRDLSRWAVLPGVILSSCLSSCHSPFSDDGAKQPEFIWRTVITEPDSGGWGGIPAVADGRVFVAAGRDIVA